MPNFNRDYQYYKTAFDGQPFPYAFVDLDLFDENVRQIADRSNGKKIRVASKSMRCASLIQRVLDSNPIYQGIMGYSVSEAVWLSQQGFDDILVGYPNWHEEPIRQFCEDIKKGKKLYLMVDLKEHIEHLNELGKKFDTVIPICIDVDMTTTYPGIRFGVWRSSINNVEQALALHQVIKQSPNVRLDGYMGYEAAIAGMGDQYPGKAAQNMVVKLIKNHATKAVAKRREDTVKALQADGAEFVFVNGGGTGSLEWTTDESVVTEATVGSGFYSSGLFDNYSNFYHYPSVAYAVEIVRHPRADIWTCHGGGYTASGGVGADKIPKPYLPKGAKLIEQEGAGEVQTPVVYSGPEQLSIGDPIYLRHSKAGEVCERFKQLLVIENGKVTGHYPTYRGDGQCFV